MILRLFAEKDGLASAPGREVSQNIVAMAVIAQDEAATTQLGRDRLVFLALILRRVVAVIHKNIDAGYELQGLDGIAVKDPAHTVVGLSQQESGIWINVGSEVLPRKSFSLSRRLAPPNPRQL